MELTFEDWLAAQHHREDSIGAFARGLKVDRLDEKSKKGKQNEHTIWVNIVLDMRQQEYVTTFNIAWQEFLVAKEAAAAELEAEADTA